jgi:hypothetical protein
MAEERSQFTQGAVLYGDNGHVLELAPQVFCDLLVCGPLKQGKAQVLVGEESMDEVEPSNRGPQFILAATAGMQHHQTVT